MCSCTLTDGSLVRPLNLGLGMLLVIGHCVLNFVHRIINQLHVAMKKTSKASGGSFWFILYIDTLHNHSTYLKVKCKCTDLFISRRSWSFICLNLLNNQYYANAIYHISRWKTFRLEEWQMLRKMMENEWFKSDEFSQYVNNIWYFDVREFFTKSKSKAF